MAECFSPSVAYDFASRDTNRIAGKIAEALARKSAYTDVLDGGTLENISEVVRSVVEEQATMGQSLVSPVFANDITTCGTGGIVAQVGTTEYQYQLGTLRGRGPRVCVKQTRTAFKGSYIQAQYALEKGILKIMNADIRSLLVTQSGVKFVPNTTKTFGAMVTGDAQAIATPFATFAPDTSLTFQALYRLATFMREDLLVDPFESDSGTMFKFIGSIDQIEKFRKELDVRADLRAFVTGKYQIGEQSLNSYAFQGPWRNIAFGIDNLPLRANGFDSSGQPVFVEPEISVPATRGVAVRINPIWINAPYEVSFLIGANSFVRRTPQDSTGEGTFRFSPQLDMGELEWRYILDNDCNLFGDFGQHIYQIRRAYQPVRPHAVTAILSLRCPTDLGFASCSSSSAGL